MYSKHKMSKKSNMKRKKHIVVVKRKSNVAKNSNNIVIRIDNSKRKQSNSKRRKTLSQPRVQEPVSIPVIRQYTDIGNYTNEILNRNNAILQEQKIKRDETEAQSTSRLPTPTSTPEKQEVTVPIIETPKKIKRDILKPTSTYRLPSDMFLAKYKRRLPLDSEDLPSSPVRRALNLSSPNTVRKLREERIRKPQSKTLSTIFGLFEADYSDGSKSISSFDDFKQWVDKNQLKKIGSSRLKDYSFTGSQSEFYKRFGL